MDFLSLIVVLAVVYWLGSARFIQCDGWFDWLVKRLQSVPALTSRPVWLLVLALLLPMLLLIVVIYTITHVASSAWLFFINVPVLLYSLGRGNFVSDVREYIALCLRGDNVAAIQSIEKLRGNLELDSTIDVNSWMGLHTYALKVIAYRGFEHTFAVLFWFVISGPLGALLYRLSILYREISAPNSEHVHITAKWLWLLEFPAVRLMGVTWALVGNFDSCPLRHSLIDTDAPSVSILDNCLRGALGAPINCPEPDQASTGENDADPIATETHEILQGINDGLKNSNEKPQEINKESQDIIEDLIGAVITTHTEPAYSFLLVKSSLPLYSRALLFWVCAIAFSTLVV